MGAHGRRENRAPAKLCVRLVTEKYRHIETLKKQGGEGGGGEVLCEWRGLGNGKKIPTNNSSEAGGGRIKNGKG